MPGKTKRIQFIFFIFWFLLAYILAALIWWFIALNNQNRQMAEYKQAQLNPQDRGMAVKLQQVRDDENRKTAQFIGEGSIFFLLIIAGAVFVFRAVRRQFRTNLEQKNFMMALTHELKTPIAVAKLNLETLQKRKLDETQQQRLLQTTLQETNRLNALCNNMLLSSQIEAGGYQVTNEETNFSELIGNCVEEFMIRYPQRSFLPGIQKDVYINGDRLLLQMIANNLLENAVKYSPKESPVSVLLNCSDNTITLQVKDKGIGITGEEKEKIFNKFYRVGNMATKSAKGTGLGLYLIHKIVKRYKGNITVTDNDPSGSVFTINLHSSNEKG
jgi:two-component system sensor histidine kinase CiaH